MGPTDIMSTLTMNSNANSSSLSVPKLCDDGSNWADYEPRLRKAMGSKGLWRHMEGLAVAPKPYVIADGIPVLSDGKTQATEEQLDPFNYIYSSWLKNKGPQYGRSHVEAGKSQCDYKKHTISVRCRRSAIDNKNN